MPENRRSTISFRTDGNGGKVMSVNLTMIQVMLVILVSGVSLATGAYAGVKSLGDYHIRQWWAAEGMIQTEALINARIELHHKTAELQHAKVHMQISQQLTKIEGTLSKACTIAEDNQRLTSQLVDHVLRTSNN